MSLAPSHSQFRRNFMTRGISSCKLPPPKFRIGDLVQLRLLRTKYGYDKEDMATLNLQEMVIAFIDETEPRYAVKKKGARRACLYFNSDEVWGIGEYERLKKSSGNQPQQETN